jgi:hypothetical protein
VAGVALGGDGGADRALIEQQPAAFADAGDVAGRGQQFDVDATHAESDGEKPAGQRP